MTPTPRITKTIRSLKKPRPQSVKRLHGITGIKTLYAMFLMNAGLLQYDMSYQSNVADNKLGVFQIIGNLAKNFVLLLAVHLSMSGALALTGNAWL